MNKAASFSSLVSLAVSRNSLRLLVLSKPFAKGLDHPTKISARLSQRRGRTVLLLERAFLGGRVSQFALSPGEIEEKLPPLLLDFGQADLFTPMGEASILRSKRGQETLRGVSNLEALLLKSSGEIELKPAIPSHILSGSEPFLFALGITSESGRVHDKRQAKFRQINRFLEYAADLSDRLPKSGIITVYDLCCGKSYLSFALYHYLSVTLGRKVYMLCMDIKEDVMRDCEAIARSAGFSATHGGERPIGMHFIAGDIRELTADAAPDLVVSLHACDTATDLVLANAVRLSAGIILSTPCCHRELSRRIKAGALAPVLREAKLKDKLSEAATDAIRCLYLSAHGYDAHTTELVDPDDTPKNTLIRAVKSKKSEAELARRRAELDALLSFLLEDGAEAYATEILELPPKGEDA